MLFGLVMMVLGGMIALLMIVWEMITHPFTVFKKVPRNGELLSDVGYAQTSTHWPSTLFTRCPMAQPSLARPDPYTGVGYARLGPVCSDSLGDGALVYKQY